MIAKQIAGEVVRREVIHIDACRRIMAWLKAVRDGDWTLVMENAASPELNHISQDRNEKKDLAAELHILLAARWIPLCFSS